MKTSLRTKTIILIILIAAILSTAGLLVSGWYINQLVAEEYRNRAKEITNTVAAVIDRDRFRSLTEDLLKIYNKTDEKIISDEWGTPEFDRYISNYSGLEKSEDFQFLLKQLRDIQDVNDVDCLYLICLDVPGEKFIYIVDAAREDACPPGCLDPVYEENRGVLKDPARGFPPYITNTEPYGWLVTAGVPIYDAQKHVIGYAMADISMEELRMRQARFIMGFAFILVVITIFICLVSIWIVNKSIIGPINKLSSAAANYSAGDHKPGANAFDRLNIHTRDEIESLCDTMRTMLTDMDGYIDSLKSTTQELSKTRLEADELSELARRDLLTGVRNKNAYNEDMAAISENLGSRPFGIVIVDLNNLKQTNDRYGHEKGDLAIKNICRMICDVFVNSPVYRFGGDEFVVVLTGTDYINADKLVNRFMKRQESKKGKPWETPKGAIGYALYDGRTDSSADEVFQRADSLMYEQKKAMKEENN